MSKFDEMFKELQEFPQYDSIPYSALMECPCGGCGLAIWQEKAKIVGWCSTPRGYMMVFECPVCFEKFRYHNCTDSRYSWEEFKEVLFKKWNWQK